MKTTKIRKLLPDGWGFFCPAHTPDGAPCGLLNHLTAKCQIVTQEEDARELPAILATIGMKPIQSSIVYPPEYITVMLNAEILGYIPPDIVHDFVTRLRYLKVEQKHKVFLFPSSLPSRLIQNSLLLLSPPLPLPSPSSLLSSPFFFLPLS